VLGVAGLGMEVFPSDVVVDEAAEEMVRAPAKMKSACKGFILKMSCVKSRQSGQQSRAGTLALYAVRWDGSNRLL
jgi:hypothetical protein